jgi:LPS export ABC transporter permease LptF
VRILTRYILGEILTLTLIGCALFTFILFMPQLPHILEVVVRNSSTLADVAQVFLFTLPNLFKVTIPMAVLWGILLGLSRLASDSEIIAMRASGLGIGYFVRVASIVAIGGTALGLGNSLYLAPRANRAIIEMEQSLETSQASYEIEPRIFYEDFRNYVLYVQDVRSGTGAANWRQVFMADVSDPDNPLITTAASATVVTDNTQELLMRLRDGVRDETVADEPEQSNISTFTTTDLPLMLSQQSDVHLGRLDTALYAMPLDALIEHTSGPDGKRFLIEMHNRFAFPAACLVLMLVGVPLGVASRRGGKSSGFVFTILLVFVYYFLSSTGIALGHQNKLPAFLAVWSANLLFACAGTFSAVADGDRRANPERDFSVDRRVAKAVDRKEAQRVPNDRTFGEAEAAQRDRDEGQVAGHLSTDHRRVHRARICHAIRAGAARLCFALDCLHFLRSVGRHSAQPHRAGCCGRISAEPDAEHALPDGAAGGADCRTGDFQRA